MSYTRETTEIAYRRQQVAEMYLRGDYQTTIADALGVDQAQISRDLKALRSMWLASAIRDFDAARAEELARIDAVEKAAWDGWERSQKDKEVALNEQFDDPIITKNKEGGVTTTPRMRKHQRLQKEGQAGSPAFLNTVLTCIERRCSILGLDAPKRFVINWDDLTDEQIDLLAAGTPPEKVVSRALSA